MSGPGTRQSAVSLGQLAKRWGIGVDRVRSLVESGGLPGAFRVPSAGRYSCTVRVPLASIELAESTWAIEPSGVCAPRQTRSSPARASALRHFPELDSTVGERDAEYHEDGKH